MCALLQVVVADDLSTLRQFQGRHMYSLSVEEHVPALLICEVAVPYARGGLSPKLIAPMMPAMMPANLP